MAAYRSVLAKTGKPGHAARVTNPHQTDLAATDAILTLCQKRGTAKSICPTEAARLLAGNPQDLSWRAALPRIKLAAARLAQAGMIDILRKGKVIAPEAAHGVVRLRLRAETDQIADDTEGAD